MAPIKRLVLASGNAGKLREFQTLLAGQAIEVILQSQFSIPDAEETGLSFVENAILKARHAARLSGLPALADDSGLEVDALLGAPGIYSARFSGEGATETRNNAKLLEEMAKMPQASRTARFHCLLVLMRHAEDPVPLICHGSWEGIILQAPSGSNGFGYDPLFFAIEQQASAADLPSEIKNRVSHRGKATAQLLQQLAAMQESR